MDEALEWEIKKEFRAQIFFSYRKKDRAEANRLMDRIRQNKGLHDVAIWYDEFLVPGEDYNRYIQEKIEQSALFLMLVTPDTLEKSADGQDNYIVRCEYPQARSLGKKILPVEMIATDRDELQQKFPNLPQCVACDDAESLNWKLEELLAGCEPAEKNIFPHRHNYLIGMAYLRGVGVKIDRELAFAIISGAPELDEGYVEYVELLSDMYRYGWGTPKNESSAVRQVQFLYLANIGIYQMEGNALFRENLGKAAVRYLNRLFGMYQECGYYQGIEENTQAALDFAEEFLDAFPGEENALDCCEMLGLAGEANMLVGDFVGAERCYDLAESCLYNVRVKYNDNRRRDVYLYGNLAHQGELYMVTGRYAEGMRYIEDATGLLDRLKYHFEMVEDPGDVLHMKAIEEFARSRRAQGLFAFGTSNFEVALLWFGEMLKEARKLCSVSYQIRRELLIGEAIYQSGMAHRRLGNLEKAQECFESAVARLRSNLDHSGSAGYLIALNLGGLGRVYSDTGKIGRAEKSFLQALKILGEFTSDRMIEWHREAKDILCGLATVYQMGERQDLAQAYIESAAGLAKKIYESTGLPDDYIALGMVCYDAGDTYLCDDNGIHEGMRYVLAARDILSEFFSQYGSRTNVMILNRLLKGNLFLSTKGLPLEWEFQRECLLEALNLVSILRVVDRAEVQQWDYFERMARTRLAELEGT